MAILYAILILYLMPILGVKAGLLGYLVSIRPLRLTRNNLALKENY